MKLFSALFGRKSAAAKLPEVDYDFDDAASGAAPGKLDMDDYAELPGPVADDTDASAGGTENDAPAAVNIWDLEDDGDDAAQGAAVAAPTTSRGRRNRTRLLGFDKSDGDVVDIFGGGTKAASGTQTQFPVGWILVVDGPGHGHCFTLFAGMSQIGRGEDQTVCLDFGDSAISRNNHAAIVFDEGERKFVLGHGGKANIVRLNDNPVISNEDLADGDRIKIGDTMLQLKILCGPDFNWSDTGGNEERDDVAIA